MKYFDLVLNLTLLISLTIVSDFIESRFVRMAVINKILQGFLFGAAAVIGMLKPFDLGGGLIFDGRSVMISLASLFYGPLTAAVAVVMTAALRISMGGNGMIMGISVILSSAGIGLLFRRLRKNAPLIAVPTGWELYLFGIIVHAVMVLLMFTLPRERIFDTMLRLGPPVLALYPFATVLAGKILSDQVTGRLRMEALRESENRFREALEFLPTPISIASSSGTVTYMNRLFSQTFGYTLDDIHTIAEWTQKAYPDPENRARAEVVWASDVSAAVETGGNTPPRIYSVTCADGTVRQASISMKVQENRFLTVFQDMTERLSLETALRSKLDELVAAREATISSMAILSEYRDTDTGAHIQRTKLYVKLMLEKMGDNLPYPREDKELVWHSAPLHDIGKIAIPDSILLKHGPLTVEEFEIMKKHVVLGSSAIRRTQENFPGHSFLSFASEIAEFHHEKWDGTGYVHGLSGKNIPLAARIMAIADVYDACISERPYKKPLPHEEVVRIIQSGSGTHFDPDLVELFIEHNEDFHRIALEYSD